MSITLVGISLEEIETDTCTVAHENAHNLHVCICIAYFQTICMPVADRLKYLTIHILYATSVGLIAASLSRLKLSVLII